MDQDDGVRRENDEVTVYSIRMWGERQTRHVKNTASQCKMQKSTMSVRLASLVISSHHSPSVSATTAGCLRADRPALVEAGCSARRARDAGGRRLDDGSPAVFLVRAIAAVAVRLTALQLLQAVPSPFVGWSRVETSCASHD